MSAAIWLLDYRVADASLDEYLRWFHQVHVPEKLARPGYTWAAHYRVVEGDAEPNLARFLALFGGETPRVFLDPSPAQLKLRQDDETRTMMALRSDGRSTVYCEEWQTRAGQDASQNASQNASPRRAEVQAPVLRLERYQALGHDEELAAWCAQEHMPYFAASAGCAASRKLIASAGGPRHAVLHELNSAVLAQTIAGSEPSSEWRERVFASVAKPLGEALIAERIETP